MAKTIQEAAEEAIQIQDACNISGIVRAFHETLQDVIWPEARRLNQGTDWVNQHPICTLFISKFMSLNRYDNEQVGFSKAYDACMEMATPQETKH